MRLASSFYLRNQVVYFTFLCQYKLNLPIKRAPTWRPPGFTADFLFRSLASLPDPVLLQRNIIQPASLPVCQFTFPSSERCPTVHLSVCDVAMATNKPSSILARVCRDWSPAVALRPHFHISRGLLGKDYYTLKTGLISEIQERKMNVDVMFSHLHGHDVPPLTFVMWWSYFHKLNAI